MAIARRIMPTDGRRDRGRRRKRAKGDLIITLGAGSVSQAADRILDKVAGGRLMASTRKQPP